MSPYISFVGFTHVFRGNIVQTFVWSGIVTFDDIFQDINVAMCSVFGKIAVHHILMVCMTRSAILQCLFYIQECFEQWNKNTKK